jgi:hypothetical protein
VSTRTCFEPSQRLRSHQRTGLEWAIRVASVNGHQQDRSSISFHPLADPGRKNGDYVVTPSSLCSSFVRAAARPFLRPGLHVVPASRAGTVKAGRSGCLCSGSPSAGHALTAPSTVPRLRRQWRRRSCPRNLEVAHPQPRDARRKLGLRRTTCLFARPKYRRRGVVRGGSERRLC